MNPLLSSIVYFALGIGFCMVGYQVFDILLPFDLNKELDEHNVAAGIAVAGIFIGIAIVISAAIA